MRTLCMLAVLALAGACASPPREPFPLSETLAQAPAAVASGRPSIAVLVCPAQRYPALEAIPGGKTVLAVSGARLVTPASDEVLGPPEQVIHAVPLCWPFAIATGGDYVLGEPTSPGAVRFRVGELKGRKVLELCIERKASPIRAPVVVESGEAWFWLGRERGTLVGVKLREN